MINYNIYNYFFPVKGEIPGPAPRYSALLKDFVLNKWNSKKIFGLHIL